MDTRPAFLAERAKVSAIATFCLVALLAACGPSAGERVSPFQPSGRVEFDHEHRGLHEALKEVVNNGWVDYAKLRADSDGLRAYLRETALVPRTQFDGWDRAERLAFLLNVYNASMLRHITAHQPVNKVTDLGDWSQKVWDQLAVDLFGRRHSLGELEHEMIRGQFKSPQVHFALVCGAKSCPPLRSEPYTAGRLEAQFSEQAREFLNDGEKNRVDLESKTVYLSKIFDWFAEDFGKNDAEILEFVAPHFGEETAAAIQRGGFRIQYTEYNWDLNDAARKN